MAEAQRYCWTDERGHHAVLGCNCRECVDDCFRALHDEDSLLSLRRKPRAFGVVAVDDREI